MKATKSVVHNFRMKKCKSGSVCITFVKDDIEMKIVFKGEDKVKLITDLLSGISFRGRASARRDNKVMAIIKTVRDYGYKYEKHYKNAHVLLCLNKDNLPF